MGCQLENKHAIWYQIFFSIRSDRPKIGKKLTNEQKLQEYMYMRNNPSSNFALYGISKTAITQAIIYLLIGGAISSYVLISQKLMMLCDNETWSFNIFSKYGKLFLFLANMRSKPWIREMSSWLFLFGFSFKKRTGVEAGGQDTLLLIWFLKVTTRKQLILFVSVSVNSQSLQIVGTAWWPKAAPKSVYLWLININDKQKYYRKVSCYCELSNTVKPTRFIRTPRYYGQVFLLPGERKPLHFL